jgi:ankyrin repeat protein
MGSEDICIELLKANCQLDNLGEVKIARVPLYITPLQCAAYVGHASIVQLLLQAGASCTGMDLSVFDPNCAVLILEARGAVPHLMHLCRIAFRKSAGGVLSAALSSVGLPKVIRDYLMMLDILKTGS